MNLLRIARIEKNLSQAELALRCGMSRQRLCKIENGRQLPTRAQSEALSKELGIGALPCSEDLFGERQMERVRNRRPFEFELYSQERWKLALRKWSYLIARLGVDLRALSWMRLLIRVDSQLEALVWILLVAAGCKVFLGSPSSYGFRQHLAVDSRGEGLGERLLPGLYYEGNGVSFWLWPQVSLRPSTIAYRPDALMLFLEGSTRKWLVFEIDGGGHRKDKDEFRNEQLKMAEVRVTEQEIKGRDLLNLLIERARVAEDKSKLVA